MRGRPLLPGFHGEGAGDRVADPVGVADVETQAGTLYGGAGDIEGEQGSGKVDTFFEDFVAHSQAFDALDRLVGQSDPLGGKTQLAYDAQDNLTEVKDPRGVTTRYEYDGLGNLTRLVSPDSGTTTFEHDAAGNVIRRTDARGAVTEYRYDALNRLIERHSPSDPSLDVQYRYDLTADGNKGIGRLGAIEGARDSLVYRYDERGNLVEQVRSIRLDQQTLLDRVTYRYDAANQLLEIGYPSGLAIGYPRNAGGQVASVTLAVGDKAPSPLVGQIAYLPFGPLQRLTWGNGIALSREYDQDYQLLRQKVGPWQSDYQHDANGNIQQHRHSLWGTLDYQYDPLDRLTEGAAMIHNQARQAGMPVGPLAISDEVSLSLMTHIRNQTARDLEAEGKALPTHPAFAVIDLMVNEYKRPGKAAGAGFYDYPANGRKHLWAELKSRFEKPDAQISAEDVRDRLLFIQAIETVRCVEEGVLHSTADANIGSIFGIGFAAWSGGALQFINQYGLKDFIARAQYLVEQYGERFEPPALLLEKAAKGELF